MFIFVSVEKNISIRLKAIFLLTVFLLNIFVGFACAMGVDMGFNTTHHHDKEATKTTVHIHADGKKHEHPDKAPKHHHDSKEDSEKDGCCNDGVIKFQRLDKNLPANNNTAINIPVFAVLLTSFFGLDIFTPEQVPVQKYITEFFHPPPPDIRILIRSFQI